MKSTSYSNILSIHYFSLLALSINNPRFFKCHFVSFTNTRVGVNMAFRIVYFKIEGHTAELVELILNIGSLS
jgi:hypothetical protein